MKSPFTRRATAVRAVFTLTIGSALVSAALPRAQAKEIEFPETGTPAQRARTLWQASRTQVSSWMSRRRSSRSATYSR